MKKILLEYASMFAYTITGLIFGFSFFLLFLNFYHMDELADTADVSAYNDTSKVSVENKLNMIRNNINVYDQNSYTGSINIYGLNNAKLRMEACLEILESDEMMRYFDLDTIGIQDAYNFTRDFRNIVLNDCVAMQINSMFSTDTVSTLPNFNVIEPYVKLSINNLLNSTNYVQNNLENSDHYYFSTNVNKINFFDIVEDSYVDTMNNYQYTLDLIVEISNWYKDIVIGG